MGVVSLYLFIFVILGFCGVTVYKPIDFEGAAMTLLWIFVWMAIAAVSAAGAYLLNNATTIKWSLKYDAQTNDEMHKTSVNIYVDGDDSG